MNTIRLFLFSVLTLLFCNTQAQGSKVKTKKTPGGLEYKIFISKGGVKIASGDMVYFKVVGKAGDSTLFDTYKNVRQPYMNLIVNETIHPGNFEEGLMLLGKGDSALFKINADSFYGVYMGTEVPSFIKKGEPLLFLVQIDSVIGSKVLKARSDAQAIMVKEKQKNEASVIENYIQNSGIKYTKTATGLYYIITHATNGNKASNGDQIGANYTGKLLNGVVFDSNDKTGKPFEFKLGAHQVIAGWDEAFELLNLGEKATLLLPSELAYGAQGAGNDIMPYTPLIFDVELVTITKAEK